MAQFIALPQYVYSIIIYTHLYWLYAQQWKECWDGPNRSGVLPTPLSKSLSTLFLLVSSVFGPRMRQILDCQTAHMMSAHIRLFAAWLLVSEYCVGVSTVLLAVRPIVSCLLTELAAFGCHSLSVCLLSPFILPQIHSTHFHNSTLVLHTFFRALSHCFAFPLHVQCIYISVGGLFRKLRLCSLV